MIYIYIYICVCVCVCVCVDIYIYRYRYIYIYPCTCPVVLATGPFSAHCRAAYPELHLRINIMHGKARLRHNKGSGVRRY